MNNTTVRDAYVACEEITRTAAKNFYYGIRLLPPDKRAALCALYAMARRIDDIGDGDLAPGAKTEALAAVRKSLHDPDTADDPVRTALADAARRYPVPISAFDELIDGVQMDLDGVEYQDFAELTSYCRCVAGTVGRLCLSVFGAGTDPRAPLFADQLGIALQQTNILRDIREDLMNGRVYLPRAELERFGVELKLDAGGALHDPDGRLAALIRHAAERAENWYCLGLRLIPELDSRSAACCAAMAGIYRQLNARILANPVAVYDRRLSLSGWAKTGVASGALLRSSAAVADPAALRRLPAGVRRSVAALASAALLLKPSAGRSRSTRGRKP